jgi:alkanesulfonate monooxygenase SsuD/methylene tetrahydromethanopterin reductase-like flavin-dependent oxidoreductase (luciferase family)
MRPWKLASVSVNLDHLSGGRLILAVGLGAPETGFANFGEVIDRRVRAERCDEGLAILTGLWSGAPLRFHGRHYQVDTSDLIMPPPPPPLQQPRIPIWVVGAWPSERSLARVLRYDGLIPSIRGEDGRMRQTRPEELQIVVAYLKERRAADQALEIIVEGQSVDASTLEPWAAAGATWWLETLWDAPLNAEGTALVRRRIAAGPPR